MKLPTLTQIARANCVFTRYQDGSLWYEVSWVELPTGIISDLHDSCVDQMFYFPIPIDDAGEGEFIPTMKGITLLRWARKHLEFLRASMQVEDSL